MSVMLILASHERLELNTAPDDFKNIGILQMCISCIMRERRFPRHTTHPFDQVGAKF